MEPQRRKATRTTSKAAAATLKVSVQSTKPTPAKPASPKPAPTKPASTKPAPTKPTPPKPAPPKSAPPKPAPTKPAPTKSAPPKPAPTEPAPPKPAPPEPAPTKAAPPKSAPTKAAPPKSAPTKAAPAKPAPTKPAPTKSAPPKPAPPKASRKKPTLTKPSECLVVPDAAQPEEQKCCSTRAPGSQRKKSTPGPQERPQVRARGARTQKARLNAEDILDGQTVLAEPQAAQEPPLPRAGSGRQRGARAQPWPMEDPGQNLLVPAPSPAGRAEAPCGWKPRAVLDKLKLSRCEISAAAEVVNKVVDHLLRRLQSCQSEFKGVELLRTGSYYEQVKVSSPNEFDIMFKLDVPRIKLEEYRNSGAHYFVKFKRNPKGNPLSQFLEKEILSASKMLSKFRDIIKEEIKNIEDLDITLERKKKGCPAVTLLIRKPKESVEIISVDIILALQVKSSWPASTKDGLDIQDWLGKKVRRDLRLQPFYLVPKHAKEEKHFQEETWRLSFSHIEKDILKNHGQSKTCCETRGVKCCRKDCLKLMKCLLEQLKKRHENRKEMKKFCSYHVKTAFLHVCSWNPDDREWQPGDLGLCFDRCLEYFLKCLREEESLSNYFIPGVNLFSQDQVDKTSKEFLLKQIEYERNNGFPIFNKS